ncbi:MAG TPA: hypothetical protein PK514_07675 [Spirochaetota bacterium]|nr:hypothetical protein [Spirochaetota bacterium]
MEISVFSDSQAVNSCFAGIAKAKGFSVNYNPLSDLKKKGEASPDDTVIYADLGGLAQPAVKKNLTILSSLNRVFGILDAKGSFDDPAVFFHAGASDYIGKALFKSGIDQARVKKVYDFGRKFLQIQDAPPQAAVKFASPLSGNDWKKITLGKEYTFCFMHIELDEQKEIKKRFPGTALEEFTKRFHNFVEESVSDINGKVWMWADLGGLVLVPFDGETCPAIFKGFSMMLNRKIMSFENFDYDMLFSYRIAIHIGSTVYQTRGDTGKIVSDSVNSIHHLKQNFAEPGNMYLTEDVCKYIPVGFEKFFIKSGTYEGREIYRLLELL